MQHIQGVSGGNVTILEGDIIDDCEKKVHKNMCLILNGYPDTAFGIYIQENTANGNTEIELADC